MDREVRARRQNTRDIGNRSAPISRHEVGKTKLLTWAQLPEWAKDNEYIQSGFRPISNSYLDYLKSSLEVHNETGNIYTHFFATVWMLALPIYFYPFATSNYPDANADDWIIFGLYFLGGAICFFLSTAYHMLFNHSHAVHDMDLRLDLLGISTVTAGCFPPGLWYSFPCLARKTKIIGYWYVHVVLIIQCETIWLISICHLSLISWHNFSRLPVYFSSPAFASLPTELFAAFYFLSWRLLLSIRSSMHALSMVTGKWMLRQEPIDTYSQ